MARILRFLLFRFIGGRIALALTAFGLFRTWRASRQRRISAGRPEPGSTASQDTSPGR